ncbi:MAG: ACT domain-containing protein [Ruminococcaceae bacterium]|nr:ACT domain-containing protein [Oscillospiraceae bacterium]
MKAVVSVIGKDSIGIIAAVSGECADFGVNIIEITQSVLDEYFAMIMIVDISKINRPFSEFVDAMSELGKKSNLEIRAMHEDIFDAMHRI